MGAFTERKLDEEDGAEKFVDEMNMLPHWALSSTQEQFIELMFLVEGGRRRDGDRAERVPEGG